MGYAMIFHHDKADDTMSNEHDRIDWQAWGQQWLQARPESLEDLLKHLYMVLPLINALDRVVFFIKDTEARYVLVNQSLVQRLGHAQTTTILGLTCVETFVINHGKSYLEQDRQVLQEGIRITEKLELHVHHNGDLGWCLTYKYPIFDTQNRIIGLMGMSVDLASNELNETKTNLRLGKIEQYIREHLSEELRIQTLAQLVNMSVSQLERRLKKNFHMTPKQLIQKIRLEQAIQLLQNEHAIADIAQACGYTDHSAFTRQFKQMTGVSPSQFKQSLPNKKRGTS